MGFSLRKNVVPVAKRLGVTYEIGCILGDLRAEGAWDLNVPEYYKPAAGKTWPELAARAKELEQKYRAEDAARLLGGE